MSSFIALLWRWGRFVSAPGLRFGSGAAQLYGFLYLLFFCVAIVLVLLGLDLEKVDLWLDRQGGWLDAVGTVLFDILIFIIGALCAFYAASFFFPKSWGEKAGLGGALKNVDKRQDPPQRRADVYWESAVIEWRSVFDEAPLRAPRGFVRPSPAAPPPLQPRHRPRPSSMRRTRLPAPHPWRARPPRSSRHRPHATVRPRTVRPASRSR